MTALVAAACIVAGCGRISSVVATGNRDQVLHIGNKDEPADLDPAINTASSTSQLLASVFQGLVTFSSDGKTILPGAAASWDVSLDGLTYTFHLRPNLRWSNGAPLTAEDFRASFLRVFDPGLGAEEAGFGYAIKGSKDFTEGRSKDPLSIGIRAPDPQTLVLTLEHPAPYILVRMTLDPFYPVYMPSLDASGGRTQRGGPWERPGALVSNGPFTLAEWRANAFVRVVRNPNFWDAGRVRLNEVRFYPTDDEAAEERAFRAGQLHVTRSLPKTKVPVYEEEHPGELHLLPMLRTNYLSFNVDHPPFTDPRVRRAFSLAVDRVRLVRAALGKLGTPAYSFIRPGTGGYTPPKGFSFDPAGAGRLLAEAGFPKGAGLPPIELSLNGNTGVALAVGEVLQQGWSRYLGVHVTLRPMEFKSYLSVIRERQFQVVMEGYSGIPDAIDLLEFPMSGNPQNDSGSRDADYDRAFHDSEYAPDEVPRRAAFDRMEAINAEKCYFAPVYYTNRGLLVSPSVRGWRDNAIDVIDWREIYLEP
jgi:oligopeptide transport system substrate-binding protein